MFTYTNEAKTLPSVSKRQARSELRVPRFLRDREPNKWMNRHLQQTLTRTILVLIIAGFEACHGASYTLGEGSEEETDPSGIRPDIVQLITIHLLNKPEWSQNRDSAVSAFESLKRNVGCTKAEWEDAKQHVEDAMQNPDKRSKMIAREATNTEPEKIVDVEMIAEELRERPEWRENRTSVFKSLKRRVGCNVEQWQDAIRRLDAEKNPQKQSQTEPQEKPENVTLRPVAPTCTRKECPGDTEEKQTVTLRRVKPKKRVQGRVIKDHEGMVELISGYYGKYGAKKYKLHVWEKKLRKFAEKSNSTFENERIIFHPMNLRKAKDEAMGKLPLDA